MKKDKSVHKGNIFFASSTETLIVPNDSLEMNEYDNLAYEEYLYHHNTVNRYQTFKQPIKCEVLDHISNEL